MDQPTTLSAIAIGPARKDDLLPILRLFDEAVLWLSQRGLEGQWGTVLFSASPKAYERFMAWIMKGDLFVARLAEHIVGSFVLSPQAPPYIADRWESFPISAFYLEAFVTSRALAHQGIGHVLLQWAEHYARNAGKTTLWLDCWAKNAALVRYYQQAGFIPHDEFRCGTWHGQLFEKFLREA